MKWWDCGESSGFLRCFERLSAPAFGLAVGSLRPLGGSAKETPGSLPFWAVRHRMGPPCRGGDGHRRASEHQGQWLLVPSLDFAASGSAREAQQRQVGGGGGAVAVILIHPRIWPFRRQTRTLANGTLAPAFRGWR